MTVSWLTKKMELVVRWIRLNTVNAIGVLAGIVTILGFLGFSQISAIFSGEDVQALDSSGASTDQVEGGEIGKIAPTVTFASGEECSVGFSVNYILPPENVIAVFEQFGSDENAQADVDRATRSSTLSILEKEKLAYVRSNREKVQDEIVKFISSQIFVPGYKIEAFNLLEIRC